MDEFVSQLGRSLGGSNAEDRRNWADEFMRLELGLDVLFPLLQAEFAVVQKLVWLISDIGKRDARVLVPHMPLLYSLRDELQVPGMHRSVAKWLWMTAVPGTLLWDGVDEGGEPDAIEQLHRWLESSTNCIASKSYSAKALQALMLDGRIDGRRFLAQLAIEARSANASYAARMRKLAARVAELMGDAGPGRRLSSKKAKASR